MMSSSVDARRGDGGEDVLKLGLGRTVKRSALMMKK